MSKDISWKGLFVLPLKSYKQILVTESILEPEFPRVKFTYL